MIKEKNYLKLLGSRTKNCESCGSGSQFMKRKFLIKNHAFWVCSCCTKYIFGSDLNTRAWLEKKHYPKAFTPTKKTITVEALT